jgi:hypothetical protein
MQAKTGSILFCFSCLLSLSFVAGSGPVDPILVLEMEQIKRHLEIRRELERDATPFLEDVTLDNNDEGSMKTLKEGNLNPIPISWMDFLTTFSLFDVSMGIFSLMALGFGSFYYVWRMNPFSSKIEK